LTPKNALIVTESRLQQLWQFLFKEMQPIEMEMGWKLLSMRVMIVWSFVAIA